MDQHLRFVALWFLLVATLVMSSCDWFLHPRASYESSGAGTMRTINTTQFDYRTRYPQLGFARDLATLGPGPRPDQDCTSEHACLIDSTLGAPDCQPTVWCTKSGYRFNLHAICSRDACTDYVATATPMSPDIAKMSFCTTTDGVIRFKKGPPLGEPLQTLGDCQKWQEL